MFASVEAVCLPPSSIPQVWPSLAPLIRNAYERGGAAHQFSDVTADVLSGAAFVWIAWSGQIEGVAVTKLVTEGGERKCLILACAGVQSSTRWLHLLGRLEQFARDEACTAIRLCGRKGWRRVLDGYREPYVVLEKGLT